MALSNKAILKEIENGDIVIDPFNPKDLCTSSYDVRLGEWFYREQRTPLLGRGDNNHSTRSFYNPYNKNDVDHVWGKPQKATTLRKALKEYDFHFSKNLKFWDINNENISLNDLVILINPGETLLAHTQEFIGGKKHITTSMQARSSQGRNFIGVCKCAGWGDVGYINRWTMEITNFSQYHVIPLVVGRRYAQIVFMETGPILANDYGAGGKYQTGSDIENIKHVWKPSMMLPKLHIDRDTKK